MIKEKNVYIGFVNNSPNLVAHPPTSFALYFWIAYLTSHPAP